MSDINQTQKIPNYLVQSILVTIFCCLPFGIVAIVKSSQVNGLVQGGNTAGALEASAAAKKWCWISFGIGIAVNIILLVIQGGAFLAAMRAQQ